MKEEKWLLCPVCKGKTRIKIFENTTLENFPLHCPKCKNETKVEVKNFKTIIITEPDAQTQSR
ncbi:MAG: cysteine-rich KTR domain-containing protein [Defluviitaleaceae bacterium]|nr:cysteine-rich KTR domain-containing protein [Defluviitaleaceae bacterium]MCL2274876.1 cysteine-rich KTR domain-containing protein [Defluviitaleaceae bacterium]